MGKDKKAPISYAGTINVSDGEEYKYYLSDLIFFRGEPRVDAV